MIGTRVQVGNFRYAAERLTELVMSAAGNAPDTYLAALQAEIEECDRAGTCCSVEAGAPRGFSIPLSSHPAFASGSPAVVPPPCAGNSNRTIPSSEHLSDWVAVVAACTSHEDVELAVGPLLASVQ